MQQYACTCCDPLPGLRWLCLLPLACLFLTKYIQLLSEEANQANTVIIDPPNYRRVSTDQLNCIDIKFVAAIEGLFATSHPPSKPPHTHMPETNFFRARAREGNKGDCSCLFVLHSYETGERPYATISASRGNPSCENSTYAVLCASY